MPNRGAARGARRSKPNGPLSSPELVTVKGVNMHFLSGVVKGRVPGLRFVPAAALNGVFVGLTESAGLPGVSNTIELCLTGVRSGIGDDEGGARACDFAEEGIVRNSPSSSVSKSPDLR